MPIVDRLLLRMLDAVPNPLFVKDAAHRWILVNDAWEAFTGLRREDVLGHSDYDFFPAADADIYWKKDDEVFASGGTNQNEERLLDAQGRERWVITRKSVVHDDDGAAVLVGILTDITEREAERGGAHRTPATRRSRRPGSSRSSWPT